MASSADSIKDSAGAGDPEQNAASSEQKKPFDIKSALENAEFRSFNGGYGDTESIDHISPDEIERRYEAFENKKALEEVLPKFFDEHIKKDKKDLGFEWGEADKQELFEYLSQTARENPERLKEVIVEHKKLEAERKEVEEKDAALARLGEDLGAEEKSLLEKKGLLAEVSGGVRILGRARELVSKGKAAKKPEKERLASIKDIDARLKDIADQKKALGVVASGEDYRAAFRDARKRFFEDFEGAKKVNSAVLSRAWKETLSAFEGGKSSLESMEKAWAALERITELKDKLPPGTLEAATKEGVPQSFTPQFLEILQRDLDAAFDAVAGNMVSRALEKYKPGFKVVNELKEVLKPIAGRERIGGMRGEAVHTFVRGEVENYRNSLTERSAEIDEKIKSVGAAKNDARRELEQKKAYAFEKGAILSRKEKSDLDFKIAKIEEKISGMEAQVKELSGEKQGIGNKKLALGEFLAVSRAEAEKRATEAAVKEEERRAEEEKTRTLENFESQLKEKRNAYLAAYKEYKASKAPENKFPIGEYGLPVGIEHNRADKLYREYNQFLETYAKALYGYKKDELAKRGLSGEKLADELAEFQAADIFSKFFIGEQKALDMERAAIWPPKQRAIIFKGLERWAKIPKGWRWAISTVLATGVAVGGGLAATAGMAGVFMFASWRLGRIVLSGFTVAGANKLFERIATPMLVKARERGVDDLKKREGLVENLAAMREEYKKKLEEAAKREKRANIARFLVGVAAGGSIGALGGDLLEELTQKGWTAGKGLFEGAAETPVETGSAEILPSSEIELEHGNVKANFDKDGNVIGLNTQATFKDLSGTEYFSPGTEKIFEMRASAESPGTRELFEAGEKMIRMEGKNLGASIRLYEELQSAGRVKEAAYFKNQIDEIVSRLADERGAGFLNKEKLAEFWGQVKESEPPPPVPKMVPAETPHVETPVPAPAEEATEEAAPPPEAPPPPGVFAEETVPKIQDEGIEQPVHDADEKLAQSEPAPEPPGGEKKIFEAVPAETAEKFVERTGPPLDSSGRPIEIYGQKIEFDYGKNGEVLGIKTFPKEAGFPEKILHKYEAWDTDPDRFFTNGYQSRAGGRLDELLRRGGELDHTRKIYEQLEQKLAGSRPNLPYEQNPEMKYLEGRLRDQVESLERDFGRGIIDHSKLPEGVRNVVQMDIPFKNTEVGNVWLDFEYGNAHEVIGLKLPKEMLDYWEGFELVKSENKQQLIESWARASGASNPLDAVQHLRQMTKELLVESKLYEGMSRAGLAGKGFAEHMEFMRHDLERRLGEIQKVGVDVLDRDTMMPTLREMAEKRNI